VPKVNLADATKRRQEDFVKKGRLSSNPSGGKAGYTARQQDGNTVGRKKATFNMDEALHQRLKITAVTQRRDMTDLMEDAIREYLDRVQ
jgi:hypothetical protein